MIHISLGMNVCVPQTGLVLKQQKNSKPTDFHIGSGASCSTPSFPVTKTTVAR